jgi:hypothetical protein
MSFRGSPQFERVEADLILLLAFLLALCFFMSWQVPFQVAKASVGINETLLRLLLPLNDKV